MHAKYLTVLSICLVVNGIVIEDHEHQHVQTLEIVQTKEGHPHTITVVKAPGGRAVTLAGSGQHGKETTFEGHVYTVIPATFIHPSSPHFFSSMHALSSHKTSIPHLTSSHKSSSTHVPSAIASAHIAKTTVESGKTTATVVSVAGGPAVTLAGKGTTTVISGSTYTVQPPSTHPASSVSAPHSASSESHSASSASHSTSGSSPSASTSKAPAVANAASSASTSASASGSHTPNGAVAHVAGSFYATAVGATVTAVGVLFGALLVF